MIAGDIKLKIIYTEITTSTCSFGPGGVGYFSTGDNTKVEIDVLPISVVGTPSVISYSTSAGSGGVFY
jgi:hypothetical protein